MSALREIRRRSRFILAPVLGALLIGYFAYHGLTGDRSVFTFWLYKQEIQEARAILDAVQAERALLDRRVSLLKPESLDPDMLDERVRWTLDFVGPNEYVILLPRTVSLN
jgi:cell division protein FtsB